MTSEASSNDIRIATQSRGLYAGFNVWVAAVPKVVILALITWVAVSPSQAGQQLLSLQTWSTASFGSWYIYVTAFFTLTCLALALWPRTGRLVLGQPGDAPEFSQFSWLSMMFGAGIGIGMLTYSTAEPIFHFASNPETIQGISTPSGRGQRQKRLQVGPSALRPDALGLLRCHWHCPWVLTIRQGDALNHSLRSAAVIWLIDLRMARTSLSILPPFWRL